MVLFRPPLSHLCLSMGPSNDKILLSILQPFYNSSQQEMDSAGDDKLLASDVRTGVRLLANGTSVDASNASEAASSSRAPAMFDDQEPATIAQNRRQSLHMDLLNAHEISQVPPHFTRQKTSLDGLVY